MKAFDTISGAPQPSPLSGLELLSYAVILVDAELAIRHANPAAENLFAISRRNLQGMPLVRLLGRLPELEPALRTALDNNWSYSAHNLECTTGDNVVHHIDCTVSPINVGSARLLLEIRPIDQQLKAAKEEQIAQQQQVSRELVRNLAHEIKNPLGGIRGSAQLLERELDSPALREYTQVIIKETDRLQELMKRLLSSHRMMQPGLVNMHEILERVRSLIHAEFHDIRVQRDYDTSLPDITGDREHLIQAILNVARNAAQALDSEKERTHKAEIVFRTRPARQVTVAKRHYPLALELQICDNGPGIPEAIRERIFYPLVSGRESGSGLGLTLAQSFVQQHGGTIDVSSRPGKTCFCIILPITVSDSGKAKEDSQ
ncbi:MAG: PAS domain-containing protein [Rhodocyclaceae bacterium]|jgi:two-component system nitrogen regulation sensor histidine kinase GlnL|nr:PAS domain-containing protein [Rhodocyclaceae bacterium]MBK6909113.1 PAS domain-containing protein [Rhodocyclaceae bacterium]